MKRHIPTILLIILCIALTIAFQRQRKENIRMQERAAAENIAPAGETCSVNGQPATNEEAVKTETARLVETVSQPEAESEKESTRRIMRNMAKTIDENPTINKMVEASQRGAVSALYLDMVEYLGLDAEETKYFMDLLMYRQMAHVDAHMKMAAGNLTEAEVDALKERTRLANETMRKEMESFLNDAEDFEEFEFYEETIGERMMLSQMDQTLGDNALSDEAYRQVLEIMYEERENYAWSTDLHNNGNPDLSAERFSQENISKHIADIKALGELMDQRMQDILTPEQLAAWRESGAAMQVLIEGQLIQANRTFGNE